MFIQSSWYWSTEVLPVKSLKKNWTLAHTIMCNPIQEIMLPLASHSGHVSPSSVTKSCINQCPFRKKETIRIFYIYRECSRELKAFITIEKTVIKNVRTLPSENMDITTNDISCLCTKDMIWTACIVSAAQACYSGKGGQRKLTLISAFSIIICWLRYRHFLFISVLFELCTFKNMWACAPKCKTFSLVNYEHIPVTKYDTLWF